jgi:hypothetical protein
VSAWLLLLFVAVLGIGIYTFHRALLYRLVFLLFYTLHGLLLKPRRGPYALDKELREKMHTRRANNDPWL